jgi:hypothetical protein
MANYYLPQQKYVGVTNAGATITFTPLRMGAVFIVNIGAKSCWFTFDGVAVASNGNGRTFLPAGAVLNLDKTYFEFINFITAGADTTSVQVVATQAPS